MIETATDADTCLVVKRTFNSARDKVFIAWTDPAQLQKWWHAKDDWKTPIAEIDLKVGGKYRLGMQDPEKAEPHVVAGVFKEIVQNEKLVYTWRWEGHEESMETLVTVLFHDRDGSTELELIHENFADKNMRDEHEKGWDVCLQQLKKIL